MRRMDTVSIRLIWFNLYNDKRLLRFRFIGHRFIIAAQST